VQILVLQHVDCEPPAAYTSELGRVGEIHTVRMGLDALPAGTNFAAVIAMGGPMGVGDRDHFDWIDAEVDYLRRALAEGLPVWGVCLGAQLLAAALGAIVYTGAVPEVGVDRVRLTAAGKEDPVWGSFDAEFPVLQWHSDTFALPAGAELLASSDTYLHQVFRHGTSYGVQFHIEASHDLASQWLEIPEYRASLEQAHGPGAASGFLAQLKKAEHTILAQAANAMSAWLQNCVLSRVR
jgi:GMP synthase (glutamine-hydrolysing)